MGYEKDVAAIVKAIEDHKKAATYDPMAIVKQNMIKKITEEPQESEPKETTPKEPVKHNLTEVFLSKERQTILLSATLTKVTTPNCCILHILSHLCQCFCMHGISITSEQSLIGQVKCKNLYYSIVLNCNNFLGCRKPSGNHNGGPCVCRYIGG